MENTPEKDYCFVNLSWNFTETFCEWMTESFTLSLFVYPNFLCTTCFASWLLIPWKRCGRGVMSRSYFTSCPSENTFFGQITTRKKRTEKSREHYLRRESDSQKINCRLTPANFLRRWQIPLTVTSCTWQTSQVEISLDKLPCPLTFHQITWQDITCQVDLHYPHITHV